MANLSTQYVNEVTGLYENLGLTRPPLRQIARHLQILNDVERGRAVTRAARAMGYHPATVYSWCRVDPVFAAQVEMARTRARQRPPRAKALRPRQVKLLLHWAEAPTMVVALERAKVPRRTWNAWMEQPGFNRAWKGISSTRTPYHKRPEYVPRQRNERGWYVRCRP